jgi:hypothetical protein
MKEDRLSAGDAAEALLEFYRIGNVVKVTAVDPVSLIEVAIVGDPRAGETALAHAAVRKLRYVLGRRRKAPRAAPDPTKV